MEMQIVYEDFELKTQNRILVGKKEQRISLAIRSKDYPYDEKSEFLFSQFGTMHMVSGLLPEKITLVNYKLEKKVSDFIKRMYKVSGKPAPQIISRGGNIPGISYLKKEVPQLDDKGVIVPFSSGKDSVYHFLNALKNKQSPHLVHIRNLNLSCCSEEKKYAEKYAEWKKVHLDTVHLKNGTPRNGFETMKSRDMFLVALMVPYAFQYGAKNIVIEGFGDETDFDLFSGQKKYMGEFNQLLYALGFWVDVVWDDKKEWEILEIMIREYPLDLAHTNSCFSYPLLKDRMQKRIFWSKYPKFPFYEAQCGGCFKCFIVNLARIAFDEKLKCSKKVLGQYVLRAEKWLTEKIRKKGSHYEDPTFLFLLRLAQEKTAL